MRWLLVAILLGLLTPALCNADDLDGTSALERATNFLWDKQHADGSWRSEYYGVMRSGQSLTPFVLYALVHAADPLPPERAEQAVRSARFIISQLDDQGALGRNDPDILEYPVYSTAYALEAFVELQQQGRILGSAADRAIERMSSFLAASQYRPANGFDKTTRPYGGWGFNAPVASGVVGHMDIAHTRKALAALARCGPSQGVPLAEIQGRALRFLQLMQKDPQLTALQPLPHGVEELTTPVASDGGFYFSPTALSANKAPYDRQRGAWPSYATATCEGVLALLAGGAERTDPRVDAAAAWLRKYSQVDYPQGIPTDHPEPWGDAVRFYHYMVRARAYRELDFPRGDRQRLETALVAYQRHEGSFVNTASPLMKEDDPLVGTALAVIALAECVTK